MDFPTSDSELWILPKVLEAFLEIIGSEAQISIKLYDKVPLLALKLVVPVVERFHHAAAVLSKSSIPSMYDVNPRKFGRLSVDDLTGSICRAVVYNHPFNGPGGLTAHRFERALDVLLLVTHRCDHYVSRHFA